MKKVLLYFLLWLICFFQSWGLARSGAVLPTNLKGSTKQNYLFCINTNAGAIVNHNWAILKGKDKFVDLNPTFQFDGKSSTRANESLSSFLDTILVSNFTISFWLKNKITSAAFSHILHCSDGTFTICIGGLYQKIGFSKQVKDSLLQSTVALTNQWYIYINNYL